MTEISSVVQSFQIQDLQIELLSSETEYGWKTAAIVNDNLGKDKSVYNNFICYLTDELISIETAINVWQELTGKVLSIADIKIVLQANELLIPDYAVE